MRRLDREGIEEEPGGIPPGVFHGLKNIGTDEALVVNVVSLPYDREEPDEVRVSPHGVLDFDWNRVDG